MSVSPERIENALTYADSWEEGAPEQLHIVSLAAALREAQAENERLREQLSRAHENESIERERNERLQAETEMLREWIACPHPKPPAPADEAKP